MRSQLNSFFVELVTVALVILFVYTGSNKLLYHADFLFQVGRSPYLHGLAKPVALGVPLAELAIAVLLLVRRCRLWGLYAAFGLMALFTGYVFIMLRLSYDLPCSCGGILEALSWNDHLWFNAIITGLTGLAIWAYYPSQSTIHKKLWITGTGLVFVAVILFSLVHWANTPNATTNGFSISLLNNVLAPIHTISCKEPNKQFCGATASQLYFLGNTPREVIRTDYSLQHPDTVSLHFPLNERISSAYSAAVDSPAIYLFANNSAALFSGSLVNPAAPIHRVPLQTGIFTSLVRISNSTLIVRALDPALSNQVFMKVNSSTGAIQQKAALLENKRDMGFSQDGMLQYDSATHRVLYLQYYTNQLLCMDTNLQVLYHASSIDTFMTGNIPVKQFATGKHNISQLPAAPVKLVNRYICACNGQLLVLSNIKADNETEAQFSHNSRIDVYSIATGKYSGSFYIPAVDGEKAVNFYCVNNTLIVLYRSYISAYRLTSPGFGAYR